MNTKPFSQMSQMIELCCECLSVSRIWLYVIIMSHTSFRVNPHSIVCLNVMELLAWSRDHIWRLKLLSIFYQIFIFHQMIAFQKLWKMFFISSKKLFSFSRYSIFCIFIFPLFSLSAIALEVDSRKILKFMMPSRV